MNRMPITPGKEIELRAQFEALANCSFNFKRSRRGTYVNPATARDWKWFRLGAMTQAPKE